MAIKELTFPEQSLLFAKLSNIAYLQPNESTSKFKELGFDNEFYSINGSDVYCVFNDDDVIVVCRGTQPTELSDIIADIRFKLVPSTSGYGEVHHGFKQSVDNIWSSLSKKLKKYGKKKDIYLTGHSLGAAMATLIATRCKRLDDMPNPIALFTYGSPKVGNGAYIGLMYGIGLNHHRWVNNADIVTRNPVFPYEHHGELHYMNHDGQVVEMTTWQIIKDRIRGFFKGIKKGKINFFVNHSIERYQENLEKWIKSNES